MKFVEKFFDSLVEDWKDAWRWFSMQAMAFLTILAVWHEADEKGFNNFFEILPEPVRKVALPLSGILFMYLRLKSQTKKTEE